MSPFASLLFSFAHAVAPRQDKIWIGDMRLEAAFVPNKLGFAFAALGLAFKFRFATLKLSRPAGIAFASVALAAVATFLVVPGLFGNQPTANATMSSLPGGASESAQDIAESRGYVTEAQAETPEPTSPETSAPPAGGTLEQQTATAPSAQETVAEATAPQDANAETTLSQESLARVSPDQEAASQSTDTAVAEVPTAPAAAITPSEPSAQEPLAAVPPAPAVTASPDAASSVAESDTTLTDAPTNSANVSTPEEQGAAEAATPDGTNAASPAAETPNAKEATALAKPVPPPATPAVDTQVISTLIRGESVVIDIQADALLTLYRDTNFSGSPRLNRYVTPGETFTANVPFSLYTDNAAAIQITADGKTLTLGKENEEQFRIFSKP